MGGLFRLFGGRGRDFQELGHCPLFGLLWSVSELSQAPVGELFSMLIHYNEHIMRFKVYGKSNLLPSWAYLVLTSLCCILNGCVTLLMAVPCLLPS